MKFKLKEFFLCFADRLSWNEEDLRKAFSVRNHVTRQMNVKIFYARFIFYNIWFGEVNGSSMSRLEDDQDERFMGGFLFP